LATKKTVTPNVTPPAQPAVTTAPAQAAAAQPPAPPAPAANPAPTLVTSTTASATHATKVDVQAQYSALVAGLLAYYQPTDQFLMKAGTFTRDELVAKIQAFILACEATKTSNQAWRADVQDESNLELEIRPFRSGIRGIVQARFGKDGVQVLQFGFAPVKVAQRTPAEKAAAVVKAKATRVARGTKGSKQKLLVTGETAAAAAAANATPEPVAQPAAPVAASPATAPVTPAAPAATPATPSVAAPAPAPATPAGATPAAPAAAGTGAPQH
jgi:hypothetical protein